MTRIREALGPEFNASGPAISHASSSRPDDEPFTATAVLIISQSGTTYHFDLRGDVVRTVVSR